MQWVALFFILFAIGLIIQAIAYWYITLPLGAIGFVIYLVLRKDKEVMRRHAEEVARQQRYQKEQQGYREKMLVIGGEIANTL